MLTYTQRLMHTHAYIHDYLIDYIVIVHGWFSIIRIHQYNSPHSNIIREKHTIIMNQGFEQLITYLLQRFLTNTSYKGTSLAL